MTDKISLFIVGWLLGAVIMFIILAPMSRSKAHQVVGEYGVVEHDIKFIIIRVTKPVLTADFYEACQSLSQSYEVVVINTLEQYEH